jgi:fermentation-respiration switch protein FrsA (DUF1100 family)
MVMNRVVLISLVIALAFLALFLVFTILRWLCADARLRGRKPSLPSVLFFSPPLIGGLLLALLRPAAWLLTAVAVLGCSFLGIVAWLITRPSLLPSEREGAAKIAAVLRRRLAWFSTCAVLVAAIAPFAISFLIVGEATSRSIMWNSKGHDLLPAFERMARNLNGFVHDPQRDLGLPFEDVEFPAVDGKILRGWFVPGRTDASVALVTVHGIRADRRNYLPQLSMFHGLGYPVLLFDCRNHGGSDGDGGGPTLGVQESRDVSSAVQFLKERGFLRIVAIGESQGAASAILAAGHDRNIDGVIASSSFATFADLLNAAGRLYGLPKWLGSLTVNVATWRLNARKVGTPLEAISRISPRPILLIHGIEDGLIAYGASQALFDHAGQPKSLWLVPAADHAGTQRKYPEEYRRRVTGFLQQYFPLPQ